MLSGDIKAATDAINEGISSSKLKRVSYSMVANENAINEYKSVEYPLVRHDGVKINNTTYQVYRRHYPVNEGKEKEDGLLQNLYGFVQYEVESPISFEEHFYDQYGLSVRLCEYIKEVKHVFSHRIWHMSANITEKRL